MCIHTWTSAYGLFMAECISTGMLWPFGVKYGRLMLCLCRSSLYSTFTGPRASLSPPLQAPSLKSPASLTLILEKTLQAPSSVTLHPLKTLEAPSSLKDPGSSLILEFLSMPFRPRRRALCDARPDPVLLQALNALLI